MPQISVGSANISTFGFSATFNIYEQTILFNIEPYTVFNGGGASLVQGIAFSVVDQDGVELASIDWNSPQIADPSTTTEWELELPAGLAFSFQAYKIIGAIKDQNGTVYQTTPVIKNICEPVGLTEQGFVDGLFDVNVNCVSNTLLVRELTNLTYNNLQPTTVTKEGVFYYPTGTISPIEFSNTPFTNDEIWTGSNRVTCTTVATYDFGDDIYVQVTYKTDSVFPVTCVDAMSTVMCCIVDLQSLYEKNCNNPTGTYAKQQLDSISIPLMVGLMKQYSGKDASSEAAYIRKTLNCDCGSKSIKQNEQIPTNPAVYNIVLQGVGGTSVPSAVVTGNTKTFQIVSSIYQVVKGDTGDLAYTITVDTATTNTVKYKLTFNYTTMAGYILDAIGDSDELKSQLNALIEESGLNLSGLNGGCVIDLSNCEYVLARQFLPETNVVNIVINGTTYNAPNDTLVSNASAIQTWLNTLSLGTWSVSWNAGTETLLVQTNNNPNNVGTMEFLFEGNTNVVLFANNCANLQNILQAIIDFLCGLTSLQVALGASLSLCYIDYNDEVQTLNYSEGNSQAQYNAGVASVICNLANRITSLTAVTCSRLKELFPENPLVNFNVATDKIFAVVGGNCIQLDGHQLGLAVMNSVNAYSDVKALFCAVECSVPGTCPDISSNNASILNGNIAIYGVSFTSVPSASQTLTVRYRVNGNLTWIVATNNLVVFANGNVSGVSPYQILGLSPGTTYDLWISNNCGGAGFVSQITVPTSTVYEGSYLLDTILYNICGNSPVTLYSASPFNSGVTMYSDVGLTTPVTGYDYIAPNTGQIYEINTGTGVVGVDTGNSCSNGTAGVYVLGNDTGTICAGTPETLYTDGAFAVGGILYTDSGLTNPVTGYSYVVNSTNNLIYNLNSVTGQIGSITGLSCGVYSGTFSLDNSEMSICGAGSTTLYSNTTFGVGITLYTDAGLTSLAVGYDYVKDAGGIIYNLNSVTAVVGAATGNSC